MYIEREALIELITEKFQTHYGNTCYQFIHDFFRCVTKLINKAPAADVVEVVRCHDCVHAVPLERNCELDTCWYMHCNLWRGDETKNVWHKYKRFYKDYSLVEHDDFCSYGERREP